MTDRSVDRAERQSFAQIPPDDETPKTSRQRFRELIAELLELLEKLEVESSKPTEN